jgi:molecular chaperone HscB
VNYFQLFGLEEKFNIDTAQLTQAYQKLQKSVHPDRFAHASAQEQRIAVQKSSMINDAFQTLKKPLMRAEYMLTIRGTELPSEQSTFKDNSFLMRQMELREMLAEIKFADDIDAAIFEANQTLESEFDALYKVMQIQLATNDVQANSDAAESLRKLKFYQKLHQELDRLEDLLFEA